MKTSTPALRTEVHIFELLRQRLVEQYPDLDDDTIRDTLEGSTSLIELIADVIRSALLDEALQLGVRSRMADLRARLVRLEERSSRKRQLAFEAMTQAGLKKLEQPDFTASVRVGSPSLVITSETSIPAAFWVPQPPKLDRQRLTIELKRGAGIAGACLGNASPTLVVRTK